MKIVPDNPSRKKVIIQVLGATGVGKSEAAICLSEEIKGEVVSADSMQVYRDFDIGTAKVPPEKRRGVPHHLIDIITDCSQYNAAMFLSHSFDCCCRIIERGRQPIVCGGTALYLTAMIRGIFPEKARQRISRDRLKRILAEKGESYMWDRLNRHDPRYAASVGKRDSVRIIRGLEIYYNQGIPPTELFKKTETPFKDYRFLRIGLRMERSDLYARIEARVDQMIRSGLVAEVEKLRDTHSPQCPPFQSLGYKEIGAYLDGGMGLDEAVDMIKRNSRHFAKRQLSWFRQEENIHWFEAQDLTGMKRFAVREVLE
jgi:tRNA dimethylallyltransferase